MPQPSESEWDLDRLDLAGYLRRVGEPTEPGPPTSATLTRLHRAHVSSVVFENLDVVLGRGVDTALEAVQDKLVRRGRGGYCYEHAVLFAAVLERLGFGVERLLARIGHDPVRPRPRSHMALHVIAEDGEWLADVGFGSALVAPMPWRSGPGETPDIEQDGWTYRLAVEPDGTSVLREAGPDGWRDLYSFNHEPQHASDVIMANHFTSTHSASPFVGQVVAFRLDQGSRTRLLGRQLETAYPDRAAETQSLDADGLVAALDEVFTIPLDDDERAHLAGRVPDNA